MTEYKLMKTKQIAIISDIHGNAIALEEVLNDIKQKGIKTIINLGDSLYGPLDPKGTFELLANTDIISISGNQDRLIIENLHITSDVPTLEFVKSQLNTEAVEWLKSLSFDCVVHNEIYCCHASPQSDSLYLLENVENNHVGIKEHKELDCLLEGISQKVVVCGHSHVPKVVDTGKKLIINSGSVGLPAYDDDLPFYHKMESKTPCANYSILCFNEGTVSVDRLSIDYDFEVSARLAEQNNRADWAKWIRTGVV